MAKSKQKKLDGMEVNDQILSGCPKRFPIQRGLLLKVPNF